MITVENKELMNIDENIMSYPPLVLTLKSKDNIEAGDVVTPISFAEVKKASSKDKIFGFALNSAKPNDNVLVRVFGGPWKHPNEHE